MEEFDLRKVYMTKITHTHTRVGKDYQAVIPPLSRKGGTMGKSGGGDLPKPALQKMNVVKKAESAEYGEDKVVDPPVKKRKLNEPEEKTKDDKEPKEKEDSKI